MMERALTELLYGKGAHVNPLACVEDLPLEQQLPRWAEAMLRRMFGAWPPPGRLRSGV